MQIPSDWNPPENTYVEVDGDTCPVPEIDPLTLKCILDCASTENGERLGDMHEALEWLRSLSDAEVEAGAVYFTDRWTWDTGHPLDRFFGNILMTERTRRRGLAESLNSDTTVNHVMDILDQLAERDTSGDSE